MEKKKKPRETITPNAQNKAEQALTQNPANPGLKNKNKGEPGDH